MKEGVCYAEKGSVQVREEGLKRKSYLSNLTLNKKGQKSVLK